MRYLILAAGMARRLGDATNGAPKCLIEVGGEPLLARLIRQIRENDATADIHIVLGYRSEEVLPHVGGCRILLNPFFDVTGIAASMWFARDSFDQPLFLFHGDLVFSDALFARLLASPAETLIGYDSKIRKPHEINVTVDRDTLRGFGERTELYDGLYGGVLKLSQQVAALFRDTLAMRVERGFNERDGYYFFVVTALIGEHGVAFHAFDFAGERWQEIDHVPDIASAKALFSPDATL